MKKRNLCILCQVFGCLYIIVGFKFLSELDNDYYDKTKSWHPSESQYSSWLDIFFEPKCHCKRQGGQNVVVRSSTAHDLALHGCFDNRTCWLTHTARVNHKADIKTSQLLETIHLGYPQYLYHQSGWIQQYQITYSSHQWDNKPLQVFFVLHSHNDPGWLSTYKSYYNSHTRSTLDRALKFLNWDSSLKFVWAEITYLAQWYHDSSSDKRRLLKKLLHNGQFEIVTGGWVMSDEGVAHYPAMLDQLVHGHQWLQKNLQYTPRHSWAIDPFGHSPTLTYLLQRSGLHSMVVQRVHFAVKRHLAYKKQLEFNWRQTWDSGTSDTDMFCHTMPFLYYNIMYSCGPDPQVCCQLDFHSKKCWAWGEHHKAEPIDEDNIEKKSWALLDQLRKKAQMYKHDVLLVPHGDDFRYTSDVEWEVQTKNLKKLFEFMNKHPSMNVQMQFGTLEDYFAAVAKDTAKGGEVVFPSLSGDFFTYNDRDDQYWSGYFTSRPFLKWAVRRLQARLRAAEILFTLSLTYSIQRSVRLVADHVEKYYSSLDVARSTSGLLQHHDAITGTARENVVKDYLNRIKDAVDTADLVIKKMSALLLQLSLGTDSQSFHIKTDMMDMVEYQVNSQQLPQLKLLHIEETKHTVKTLVVYNTLTTKRTDIISALVSAPDVTVTDIHGNPVRCQINPTWQHEIDISESSYEVVFETTIPALAMARYIIRDARAGAGCPVASINIFNGNISRFTRTVFKVRRSSESRKPLYIENQLLRATTCLCTGLLKMVTTLIDGVEHQSEMHLVTYGTGSKSNPFRDKSGAYIFMPDGAAKELKYEKPTIIKVEGPLTSSITTHLPLVSQKIVLANISGPSAAAIHIENLVDISQTSNLEVAMRILTDVRNADRTFYTDLNGFQMHQRQTLGRLTLQGNFYPMTSMMYIEDDLFRVTLVTAQSHGAAALQPGSLEVMLDRHLDQDDWRGLNEGVADNVLTLSRFRLIWETRKPMVVRKEKKRSGKSTNVIGFPSLLSHLSSLLLDNPAIIMQQVDPSVTLTPANFEPLNDPLPCDMHLLNLRSFGSADMDSKALVIFHRLASDCDFPEVYQSCHHTKEKMKWTELFSQLRVSKVEEMTITGIGPSRPIHHSFVTVPPMEIKTFKVELT